MSSRDPADWAPVLIHTPLTFDLTPEPPPPGLLGNAAAVPVTGLPSLPFDLRYVADVPVLRLTLHLRPDADPAQLTLDVLALIDALNRQEQELGGRGVTWDRDHSRAERTQGIVHLVLAANDKRGANERLERLAAIATATPSHAVGTPAAATNGGRSFTRLEATVGGNAA